jgi:hypothetical protein
MQFFDGPPLGKLAPSGGRAVHKVTSVEVMISANHAGCRRIQLGGCLKSVERRW